METLICMVRHGQTDCNKLRKIQGHADNPLNSEGIKQAQNVGEFLLEIDPTWDIIYSSPLKRAYRTALEMKNKLGITKDIIIRDDLIERDFGQAEGEIISVPLFDDIVVDNIEGLEKSKDLQNRICNALLDIAKENQNKKVLIVTHSHVIKGVLTTLTNEITFRTMLHNTSLNYFLVKDDKISLIKYDVIKK